MPTYSGKNHLSPKKKLKRCLFVTTYKKFSIKLKLPTVDHDARQCVPNEA